MEEVYVPPLTVDGSWVKEGLCCCPLIWGAAEVGIHPEIHRDDRDPWEQWWLGRDTSE